MISVTFLHLNNNKIDGDDRLTIYRASLRTWFTRCFRKAHTVIARENIYSANDCTLCCLSLCSSALIPRREAEWRRRSVSSAQRIYLLTNLTKSPLGGAISPQFHYFFLNTLLLVVFFHTKNCAVVVFFSHWCFCSLPSTFHASNRVQLHVMSARCPFHYKAGESVAAPVRTGLWSGTRSPSCGDDTSFRLTVSPSVQQLLTLMLCLFPRVREEKPKNRLRAHICRGKARAKWHKKVTTRPPCCPAFRKARISSLWHISMTFNLTFNH